MSLGERALLMLIAATAPGESPEAVRLRLEKRRQESANGFRLLTDYAKSAREQRKDLAKKLAKKKRLASPDLDM